ncbi:MAG: hypothetical protein OXG38_12280 [Chloroflexi bacterium]|nr:hypothetical protein [Chloroflexota bacterium]
MRRLTVLLIALTVILAACGGEDRSAEVERLQADVDALRAEVAYLAGELEIAQSERDRAQEELTQTLADLERQTAIAEAAAAAVPAASGDTGADDADATAAPAPASDEVRAYLQQLEAIFQGATAYSAGIVAKIDATARTGDLDATKTLFGDLAQALAEATGKAAGLEPPPALASLHGEFIASQEGFAQAMADYARAIGNVTTWEGFGAVVEAFPQSPDFLAAAGRAVIACFALQEAGAESGVTVDLRCEGI